MGVITIERKVLEKNDQIAQHNRAILQQRKIFALNLLSSPGSGKTSILERTLEYFDGTLPVAVIEGDVQTDLDAQRIAKYNIPVVQVVTNGMCHLEAQFVGDALNSFAQKDLRLLVIENVGNLVCPANYDLGEAQKVVVVSTTEGEDKPLKYPTMFRNAAVLIINKIDLVPYLPIDLNMLRQNALHINPSLKIFELSCTTKTGVDDWCRWITKQVEIVSRT